MKTITLIICTIFLISISYINQISNQNESTESGKLLSLNNPDPNLKNSNVDQNWYQKAISNIQKEEYNISFNETTGEFHSTNRANNLRFTYHKNGFTVIPREVKRETQDERCERQEEWSIKFKVESSSAAAEKVKSDNSSFLQVAGNKASVESENLRIEYTNNEKGMRQDFIVKNKFACPYGEGVGNLRLEMSADTKLNMNVNADGLKFTDNDGKEKMNYNSLKVWDADGRELSAYFERTNQLQSAAGGSNDKLQIEDLEKHFPNSKSQSACGGPNHRNSKLFTIVVIDKDATYPITIDPISISPDWTEYGGAINDYFGISVSSAGDVNGDEYDDVIISATGDNRVYVYHGSAMGLPDTANWTAQGSASNFNFGVSVSSAGDVNGDGYDDVIVGADFYRNGENAEGGAFVYHGSASGLSDTASWSAESNQINTQFGYSVSSAGDINDDGYDDVVVGAPYFDNPSTNEGKVYVYLGSETGLSASADWTDVGDQEREHFGISVSSAGDVNGDGISDIIVGADGYNNGNPNAGRIYAYYGSDTGLSATADWTVESNLGGAFLGSRISTAGDVNGDGFSDIIAGIHRYHNGQNLEGAVYVFNGSDSGLPAVPSMIIEGNVTGIQYGWSVSGAGDINNDGYSEIIVGTPKYDNGQTDEGGIFIHSGSPNGIFMSADLFAESNQANSEFGTSVASIGDVNGDSYADFIVGAYKYDNDKSNQGRVFVFYGSNTILPPKVLDLKLFIEGFYDEDTDTMVEDTITVNLRSSISPFEIVRTAKAVVNSSGQGIFSFQNTENKVGYYLHIKHRNCLETWSKTPQQFTLNELSYEFTTANTQAYGDNMAVVDNSPLSYAIYSGDEDQNGIVDLSDVINISNAASVFKTGYVSSDINGDNATDLTDMLHTYNNSLLIVSAITP